MKKYLRSLTAKERKEATDRHLAFCIHRGRRECGGFMAVHRYTPHRSGIISAIADNIVGNYAGCRRARGAVFFHCRRGHLGNSHQLERRLELQAEYTETDPNDARNRLRHRCRHRNRQTPLLEPQRSRNFQAAPVRAARNKLRLLTALIALFLVDGVSGAIAFDEL